MTDHGRTEKRPVNELETLRRKVSRLEESEALVRAIAEQSPNMIFVNAGGNIVFVNPRCEQLLGYTREEFLSPGFDFMKLIAPEHRERIRENLGRHMSGEDIPPYEYSLVTKNGMRMEALINTKLIAFRGAPAILGIVTDITERKGAEMAIRFSEDRYRATTELTSDFSYGFRADTRGAFEIEWIGGATRSITGYTNQELAREGVWHGLIHPDDAVIADQHRRGILQGESSMAEYRIVAKDGKVRWVRDQTRMKWLDKEHSRMRIWGAVQDISDQKRAEREKERMEAQLRQAQKMEAVGRLAGGVAHDFNNLITAITGYSDILLKELKEGDPMRADIMEIRQAGKRAAALTRQLLAFSRNQPLEPHIVDLNGLVSGIERMLKPIIGEDIELVLDTAPDLARVKADTGQVEQVIMNLAVNARDAMPGGGRLAIATRNVHIGPHHVRVFPESRQGLFACLSIRDTGAGIPDTVRSHIFEPFFTTKEEGKGTGLGLSVAYGIISQHGGWINVYSEPGHGAEFKVYLPAFTMGETDRDNASKGTLANLGGAGQSILLVEDEDSVRLFAARLLKDNGYRVCEAASAREALDIYEKAGGAFDLLFTDIVLPDMPGPRLYNQLLEKNPSLKAVLTSGYSDERSFEQIPGDSSHVFIQKPYLVEDLLKTMRGILGDPSM
ncbi:MAG: PAS domain S-box protein [Chitinivibrionales bacterium]|nr:PAS domain S-box protein [Chitinivibrionales bacterium]MBD3396177.1 PAS domain S-box protein [Chitinivibrionales bacterium]